MFGYLFAVCIFLVVVWLKRKFSYWENLGVKQCKILTCITNFFDMFTLRENEARTIDKYSEELGNVKYGGYYFLWKPILVIKDPEMIKRVTVKDIEIFTDHPAICDVTHKSDAVLGSLFFLNGEHWKSRRTVFTQFFTPRRLRTVHKTSADLCKTLFPEFDQISLTGKDVEIESLLIKFTINVTLSAFLCIDIKDQSDFHLASMLFSNPTLSSVRKMMLYNIYPEVNQTFRLTNLNKTLWNIFSPLVQQVMSLRQKDNNIGTDFFSFLTNAKIGNVKNLEDVTFDEVVGHVFSFFVGGHDTTSISVSFVLFELSRNQEVQIKLRNELEKSLKQTGEFTYESLKAIPYLKQIMRESSRMYPLLGMNKRLNSKPYKLDENLTIPKGTEVVIPVRSLHYDPQYFPDPHIFNPDRFEDPPPDIFMPFGKGPRQCIGMRFAEVVMKVCIALIVLNYDLIPSNKNKLPFQYSTSIFVTTRPKDGIWIKMKKRDRS